MIMIIGEKIMANRLYFKATPHESKIFIERFCEFEFYSGFSITQKQKCIKSLHNNILLKEPRANILEISTKSDNSLGVSLSAFNLKLYIEELSKEVPVENIFQSSKVFKNGGHYTDLLEVSSRDAKGDERLRNSGDLIGFHFNGVNWPLVPKTIFYDWIYINALNNTITTRNILSYNVFTDIEFNHNKSINCQARSAAIYVSLLKMGLVEKAINDIDFLKTIYKTNNKIEQMSLY